MNELLFFAVQLDHLAYSGPVSFLSRLPARLFADASALACTAAPTASAGMVDVDHVVYFYEFAYVCRRTHRPQTHRRGMGRQTDI